jgi:son of sevenless
MYGSANPFSTPTTDDHAMNQGQLAPDEQYISTFFCRALYDYQARDASSLSFHKNDIIEVLTQLESGWWDGLLGDERGWFPSNYVTPISDEEAEAALFGSEYSAQPPPTSHESVDMPQGSNLSQEQADRDRDWLGSEMDATASRNGAPDVAAIPPGRTMQPSDFWIPKVTSDGQVRAALRTHLYITY